MKLRHLRTTNLGMLLAEAAISAGITGVVLMALLGGSMALQRQFSAATTYADAQSEQIRVMDYMEMDLRRATAVTTGTGTTPLSMTLPNFYQTVNGKKVPRIPTKAGATIQYGTGSVAVSYSLQGTNLIRTEAGVGKTIATTVSAFPAPVRDGKWVSMTLTFSSNLSRSGPVQSVSLSSKTYLRNLK